MFKTRKFVMAILHWKQGLSCDQTGNQKESIWKKVLDKKNQFSLRKKVSGKKKYQFLTVFYCSAYMKSKLLILIV